MTVMGGAGAPPPLPAPPPPPPACLPPPFLPLHHSTIAPPSTQWRTCHHWEHCPCLPAAAAATRHACHHPQVERSACISCFPPPCLTRHLPPARRWRWVGDACHLPPHFPYAIPACICCFFLGGTGAAALSYTLGGDILLISICTIPGMGIPASPGRHFWREAFLPGKNTFLHLTEGDGRLSHFPTTKFLFYFSTTKSLHKW